MQQTKDTKDNKEKIRVFALARTLGVDSKTVIDLCKGLGFEVKSQLASLEPEQVDQLKQRLTKGGKPAPAEAPRPTSAPAVTLPPKDKKIVNLQPQKALARPEPTRPAENLPGTIDRSPEPTPAAPEPISVREPEPVLVQTPEPRQEKPAPVPVEENRAPAPVQPAVEHAPVNAEVPQPLHENVVAPAIAREETPLAAPVTTPAVAAAVEPAAPKAAPTPVATPAKPLTATTARMPNLSGSRPATLNRPPQAPKPGSAPATTSNPPKAGAGAPPTSSTPPTSAPTPGSSAPARPAGPPAHPPHPGAPRPPVGPTSSGSRPGVIPNRTGPGAGGQGAGPRGPMGQGMRPGGSGGSGPMGSGGAGPGRGPTGPGAPTTAGGGAGAPGNRHRRTDRDRQVGLTERRTGPIDPKKAPGPVPTAAPKARTFSPEELKQLRDGTNLTDLLKKKKEDVGAPPAGVGIGKGGAAPDGEIDPDSEEGKKKKALPGRETRHADRAKRQEQRKVRQTSVVVGQNGQVDVIEEERVKRGKRPKPLLKKKDKGTLPPKDSTIFVTAPITIRSLSEAIGMKVGELMLKLKQLTTTLYTVNSSVEFDIAELIATEKNLVLQLRKAESAEDSEIKIHTEAQADESKLEPRAPVVTIMGHVDHGKTSLLDKIRASNVVDTEAGGITQVIRAWRVEHNGKPITFLDTPGHEAFTKMRARGANVTDIAVIVVAANDGVMPQTEEAIAHAKAAGVSIVVAINKIDLPDANIKRTEQQLYGLSLLPDTMGGDCQFVYTSASKGTGIDELLETLSLVAELKELKANPHKPAMGVCLEAHLSGDEGVRATVLVQQGTLHRGDVLLCGAAYGRVRAMYDDFGRQVKEAGPSMPVVISGLDEVPNADDHFHVVTELAKAREIAERRKTRALEATFKPRETLRLEHITEAGKPKITELKVVLKAEARGSVEAIRKELEKLVHDEVRVRILHAGIGAITESDVQLALASPEDSLVVGFNVVPDDNALRLADDRGIKIREYDIIYKLTEDIKSALEGKLKPREEIVNLGRAIVKQTFKVGKVGTIAGCHVTQGLIERSSKIRVIRDGTIIFPTGEKTASLESLKHHKNDVREIKQGFECGMKIANYDDIKVNDVIEAYRIDHIQRTL